MRGARRRAASARVVARAARVTLAAAGARASSERVKEPAQQRPWYHSARVVYLCRPKRMPTGSARPSPMPLMRMGIITSTRRLPPAARARKTMMATMAARPATPWLMSHSSVCGRSSSRSMARKHSSAGVQRRRTGLMNM